MASSSKIVEVSIDSILKELRCPICLHILKDTICVCACLHRFCQNCFESALRKCGHYCPMCREEVKSRRHTRKDTACDGFIEALDLRNIERKLDKTKQNSVPFGVRFKKEIQQNRLRQLRPEPIIRNLDYDKEEMKVDSNTNISALPSANNFGTEHSKVSEYLLRFEPLETNSNESGHPKWERWFKSKEICFAVIQKMTNDLERLTERALNSYEFVKLYCDDPMNFGTEKRIMCIENEKHLTEIGALICEIFPVMKHNDIVKAQQSALSICDRLIDIIKQPRNNRDYLFAESVEEPFTEQVKIPTSENSAAKPFRMFYSCKLKVGRKLKV